MFNLFEKKKEKFKDRVSFQKRKEEALKIMKKYPDRLPVIVEKVKDSDVPDIDREKYLVPSDLTVGQFLFVIRKRIKLTPEKALFLFVNKKLPNTSELVSNIYNENKEECGFLFVEYSGENAFG